MKSCSISGEPQTPAVVTLVGFHWASRLLVSQLTCQKYEMNSTKAGYQTRMALVLSSGQSAAALRSICPLLVTLPTLSFYHALLLSPTGTQVHNHTLSPPPSGTIMPSRPKRINQALLSCCGNTAQQTHTKEVPLDAEPSHGEREARDANFACLDKFSSVLAVSGWSVYRGQRPGEHVASDTGHQPALKPADKLNKSTPRGGDI